MPPISAMSRTCFGSEIDRWSPLQLSPRAHDALYAHYEELLRWNRTLALVGPGNAESFVGRHYGESLAALPLIGGARFGVDIGSGAGFPGQILAAAQVGLHMTLTEVRERKWSFLLASSRKASLSCHCLNVRVAVPLPEGMPERIDLVTTRAWRVRSEILAALATRMDGSGRILLWVGEDLPPLPAPWIVDRDISLPGSERRRILELRQKTMS